MANARSRPRRPPPPSAPAPTVARDGSLAAAPRTERLCTWAARLLAAGLGCGLLYMILGPHRIGDYMAETDFYGAYAQGAQLVEQGKLLPARFGVVGPGYEVLLGLTGFVIHDLFFAAELLSLAATLVTLWLWFDLLRRRTDARIALAAVALYSVNTFVFRYGFSATTDAVSVALQSAALHRLLAGRGRRALPGAGLFAAAAFLTRYNAIYLLPAGLLMIAARANGAAQRPRGAKLAGAATRDSAATPGAPAPARRLVAMGWFTLGFFAPVVPWVLYSLAHGGGFSFQLHHNIAYEVFARSKGIPWDDYQKYLQPQFHNLWDVISRDPGAVMTRMGLNVFEHLQKDATALLGFWPAAAAGAGLILLAFDRRARTLWPVLLAAALLFLTLVPAFYSERYSLALVPMYCALGGVAFGSPRLAIAVRGRVWLKPLLIVLPLWFALAANVRSQRYLITQLPTEVLDAASVLRELKRPGDRVIARKPHLAFHAGVEAAPFPFADSLADLARGALREKARWLYVSWPEVETRPAFWHLLDTTGVVPGLTVRRVTRPHPSVLYEIGPGFGQKPWWFDNDTLRAWHAVRGHLKVEGGNPKILAQYAALARAMGDREEARRVVEIALRIDPNQLEAQLEMAALAYTESDYATAIDELQRAVTAHPESPDARIGLGWAFEAAGKPIDAAQVWRSALNRTNDPSTLRHMARVFRQVGDKAGAAEAEAALVRLGASP